MMYLIIISIILIIIIAVLLIIKPNICEFFDHPYIKQHHDEINALENEINTHKASIEDGTNIDHDPDLSITIMPIKKDKQLKPDDDVQIIDKIQMPNLPRPAIPRPIKPTLETIYQKERILAQKKSELPIMRELVSLIQTPSKILTINDNKKMISAFNFGGYQYYDRYILSTPIKNATIILIYFYKKYNIRFINSDIQSNKCGIYKDDYENWKHAKIEANKYIKKLITGIHNNYTDSPWDLYFEIYLIAILMGNGRIEINSTCKPISKLDGNIIKYYVI